MSIVLLRKMTRKSIIGFGNFTDLTVQNLMDMRNHKALLEIYYFFRNIDFSDDVLEELFIKEERLIDKKAIQKERVKKEYYRYIKLCLGDIINKASEPYDNKFTSVGRAMREKRYKMRNQQMQERALNRTIYSKGSNKSKNQW